MKDEKLCHKFGAWGEFVECVNQMPVTWLPAALLVITEACVEKKVFQAGGLQKAIEEKLNYLKNPSKKREQL